MKDNYKLNIIVDIYRNTNEYASEEFKFTRQGNLKSIKNIDLKAKIVQQLLEYGVESCEILVHIALQKNDIPVQIEETRFHWDAKEVSLTEYNEKTISELENEDKDR